MGLSRREKAFVIDGILGERRLMAEVICGECSSRADDVVCRSCYDSKVKEVESLEDEVSDKSKEISRLENEVSRLEDKVSELEQK